MAVDTPARIAILGAGPIGLEAALYARYLGYDVVVYERGDVGQHVRRWRHVRMFSPWRINVSPLAVAALRAQDEHWQLPPLDELPTGQELLDRYLLPLAGSDLLVDNIRTRTSVQAVGRGGPRKGQLVGQEERRDFNFHLLVADEQGRQSLESADVVIDSTGTLSQHNYLGQGGLPALGEIELADRIAYRLPDILGTKRRRYADRHTLVVGNGYSAATNVVALAQLSGDARQTRVTWVTWSDVLADQNEPDEAAAAGASSAAVQGPICRIPGDRLPERDRLAAAANELAAAKDGPVTHLDGTWVEALTPGDDETLMVELGGRHAGKLTIDRLIANVGYRPDREIYRELQVHECYVSEAPMKFAAALLAHKSVDCLDPPVTGAETLVLSEPDFYIIGAKSYGRGSQFLLSTGREQICQIFSIIGDRADLDLYATMEKLTGG